MSIEALVSIRGLEYCDANVGLSTEVETRETSDVLQTFHGKGATDGETTLTPDHTGACTLVILCSTLIKSCLGYLNPLNIIS